MKNSHLEKCLFKLCWSSGDTSPPFRELEIGGILYMFRPNGLQKNTFFLPRIFFRLWGASPTSQSPSNSPALGVGVPWHISVTWVYVSRFHRILCKTSGFFVGNSSARPETSGHLVCLQRHVPFGVPPLYRLQPLASACQTCWGRLLLTVWKFDLEPFFFIYNYSY